MHEMEGLRIVRSGQPLAHDAGILMLSFVDVTMHLYLFPIGPASS